MEIAQDVKDLIDKKAQCMNKDSSRYCERVSESIKQLNEYIAERIDLSDSEIESRLDLLVGYFTTTLNLPIDRGLKISRATKFDRLDDPRPCHKEVSRLSYIPESSGITPSCGRLNKKGESIFYGCIYFNDDDSGINVALAEINARKFDNVNILKTISDKEITVRYIGIFDYVKREEKPYYLREAIFKYFLNVYKYMKKKFDRQLFIAFQLCDAFFADILSRDGSDRLYQVTSILASFFMEDEKIDGIIYSSVRVKGSPVIVLKPKAVDDKLTYKSALALEVNACYGYAIYNADTLFKGEVSGNSIDWK